jgi:hypothetical protein
MTKAWPGRYSLPCSSNNLRSFSNDRGEQHVDDEFVFPVHTSCDTDNGFMWSGASIHTEVCNLNSDEFIPEKKSILLRSKNVVVLKAEHKGLGMVSFVAIKSEDIPDWRFCSIAIHGDPIAEDKAANYFGEIKDAVDGLLFCLFGKQLGHSSNSSNDSAKCAVLKAAQSNFLTPQYLVGNYPHDSGHFKFPGNYYRSGREGDAEKEESPFIPGDAEMNVGAVVRDHAHLMSVLNPSNSVAAAQRNHSLATTRHEFFSEFVNTSANVSAANISPLLVAECSAWVTVDLNLETPMQAEAAAVKEHVSSSGAAAYPTPAVIRTKVPTASSTKMLLQLIPHWDNSVFTWKVCNIFCVDE